MEISLVGANYRRGNQTSDTEKKLQPLKEQLQTSKFCDLGLENIFCPHVHHRGTNLDRNLF